MSSTVVDGQHVKPLPKQAPLNLALSWAERRRQAVTEDPSLVFGATVFAQLVAGDLARAQMDESLANTQDSQAGEEASDVIVEEGAADGFFSSVTSAGNLAPALGALGVVAGVPSPGSDGSSGSAASGAGASSSDNADPSNDADNSTVSRSVTAVRRGQQPNAEGAEQTSPDREAAGAQSTATETQQEFVSAGGNPFGAGVPTDPTVMPSRSGPDAMGSLVTQTTTVVGQTLGDGQSGALAGDRVAAADIPDFGASPVSSSGAVSELGGLTGETGFTGLTGRLNSVVV